MTTAYRIKNWDEHFELAQSRPYKNLSWVKFPNRHDGKGFRRVSMHHRNSDLFTAWILIVQVASKMKVRGLLVDDDGPLTAEDLADKTGFAEDIFLLAFEELTKPRFRWLEVVADSML